jgi:uncharacterized membrane protein
MKIAKFNLRSQLIDALRGFTIILMIFFHFNFDLFNFGFLKTDIVHVPFWYFLPRLIVFLFLFAVGMSLTLTHQHKILWIPFGKRFFKISSFALLISLVTYYLFPDNWIYFGTLHAIALISLITLPFLKWPKLSLFIALALFIPSIFFDKNIPWLGASLLGVFAVQQKLHLVTLPDNATLRFLNFLGRNSLIIYLVHQPLLFGAVYLFYTLKK